MKRSLFRLILFVSLIAGVCGVGVAWAMLRPLPLHGDRVVHIARRTTMSRAIDSVDAQCGLPTPMIVKMVSRIVVRVTQKPVQYGWYVFSSKDTQWDVVIALVTGRHRPATRVTIPEGFTYREIASVLHRKLEIDSAAFIEWCENDSVVQTRAKGAPSMEGYLMPETYDMLWRDDASAAGDKLAEQAKKIWSTATSTRSRNEILTLASIVQAEAAVVSEMPRIAGVYVNRLRTGMHLDADPTVQYGQGQKKRVLYRDLAEAHAYNTYMHEGLPPGPICNPGVDAIRAAIQPEKHTFFFFVARGDGTGLHRFAHTGAEHMENVRLYRNARR